jgi:hypothetical protein
MVVTDLIAGTAAPAWTGPALLVPMTVEALPLTSVSYTQQAAWSWIAPDYEALPLFRSPTGGPFDQALPAPIDPAGNRGGPGVIVRWVLPDTLTAGSSADETGAVAFPAMPNRWLVLRRVPGSPSDTASWILASDCLESPSGSSFYASIPPATTSQPTTIGRCWPLPGWPGEAKLRAGPDPPLTAVGLGDPAYAAYVPNVQQVLAFFDPFAGAGPSVLSYAVFGWHAGVSADPLSLASPEGWPALMAEYGWSVGDYQTDLPNAEAAGAAWVTAHGFTSSSPLPARVVYHGLVCGVAWPGAGEAAQSGIPVPNPENPSTLPALSLAHTSADALAATVSASMQSPPVAEVLTALLGDLLPLLSALDGEDELALRLQDSWFQSEPGGTRWEVVSQQAAESPSGAIETSLTSQQAAALDALNTAQQTLDAAARQVASLQWDVYAAWWKVQYVSHLPPGQPPPVPLPTLTDALTAKQHTATAAINDWTTAATQRDTAQTALSSMIQGQPLQLREVPEPPFWTPNEPVALLQNVGRSFAHGEDGRFSADGTLFCRFSGQTITSLLVTGTTTPVTAQTLSLPPLVAPQYRSLPQFQELPPELEDLAVEAFFLDPQNAPAIAEAAGSSQPAAVVATQQTLCWNGATNPALDVQTLAEAAGLQSEYGTSGAPVPVPSKVAVEYWTYTYPQPSPPPDIGPTGAPWEPLYLHWAATYIPSQTKAADPPLQGWTFPPASAGDPLDWPTAEWTGGQVTDAGLSTSVGRAILTPQAASGFAARLEQLLNEYGGQLTAAESTDICQAIDYLQNAGVLSQALSGLNDLLLQRDPAMLVPPPSDGSLDTWLAPPNGPKYTPTAAPSPSPRVDFAPLRAGFLQVNKLWVVDEFGQLYDVLNAQQAHSPVFGTDLTPDPNAGAGLAMLKPRLTQPSRLLLRFVDADDDSKVVGLATGANPICGWLVPNRLDESSRSIMVYDAAGGLQGELLLAGGQSLWLPAPDQVPPSGQTQPPQLPNPHLQALVTCGQVQNGQPAVMPAAALTDLLATINAASWAITPSGPDADLLNVMIGFPIAVARAQVRLELNGNAATSQRWTAPDGDDGGITQVAFPVMLGSGDLPDDGLVGYFLDDDPAHLSSPYGPSASGYVTTSPVSLSIGQPKPKPLTVLLHPQSQVHAFSGILPPFSAELPAANRVAPVRSMEVTFRAGPLLTSPTAVNAPLPALSHEELAWLAYEGPAPAVPLPLRTVDTAPRLEDMPARAQEGWIRVDLTSQSTQLTYRLDVRSVAAGGGVGRAVALTVMATNQTGSPVTCDSITITLPTGNTAADLTDSPSTISASEPLAPAAAPGSFIAMGTSCDTGNTLSFGLAGIVVTPTPGTVQIGIQEVVGGRKRTASLPLVKYNQPPATST